MSKTVNDRRMSNEMKLNNRSNPLKKSSSAKGLTPNRRTKKITLFRVENSLKLTVILLFANMWLFPYDVNPLCCRRKHCIAIFFNNAPAALHSFCTPSFFIISPPLSPFPLSKKSEEGRKSYVSRTGSDASRIGESIASA